MVLDTKSSFYRPPSEGWGKVIVSACSHLGGGTPSQVWVGGYPISVLDRGGTPSQVQVGGVLHPRSRYGVPHPRSRGYHIPGGYPGYPHGIASTCCGYAAGGMPLAFMQEDFLVYDKIKFYILRQNLCQTCFMVFPV